MENQKVHEYTVETGANGLPQARLGRVHNLITFIRGGNEKVHYLNGKWVDDGKNPIDENTIPDDLKAAAAAIPFKPERDHSSQVLVQCEFCNTFPEGIASGDYARHLIDAHVRPKSNKEPVDAVAPGLDQPVDPSAADAERPARMRPEQLPPGNYVTDEEGFVLLNQDGSPKKKAGRPKTAA